MGRFDRLFRFLKIPSLIVIMIYYVSLAILALASLYLWLKYSLWWLRWRSKRIYQNG